MISISEGRVEDEAHLGMSTVKGPDPVSQPEQKGMEDPRMIGPIEQEKDLVTSEFEESPADTKASSPSPFELVEAVQSCFACSDEGLNDFSLQSCEFSILHKIRGVLRRLENPSAFHILLSREPVI